MVDLDACAGYWSNAYLTLYPDVFDCTENIDVLSMLQAEFEAQPTRRRCVHCQDWLMRHKRIVNGPEILLIPLFSNLEREDRRTAPLTTELSLESISAPGWTQDYSLRGCTVDLGVPHVFAVVRGQDDFIYSVDQRYIEKFETFGGVDRRQYEQDADDRWYPTCLVYSRKSRQVRSAGHEAFKMRKRRLSSVAPDDHPLEWSLSPAHFPSTAGVQRSTANAIASSVEQHETEVKDMALDGDVPDNRGGNLLRKRRGTGPSADCSDAKRTRTQGRSAQVGTLTILESPTRNAFAQLTIGDFPKDRSPVQTLRDAFSTLTSEEASKILSAYNNKIQAAVDALSSGPRDTLTLDDIPLVFQEAATKLYTRFPHLPLTLILDAVRKHPHNLGKAFTELSDDEELSFGFTETIGTTKFASRLCLTSVPPSSEKGPKQSLRGHARFRIGNKMYSGTFRGTLHLEETYSTPAPEDDRWRPLTVPSQPRCWEYYYDRFKEHHLMENDKERALRLAQHEIMEIQKRVLRTANEVEHMQDSKWQGWQNSKLRTRQRRDASRNKGPKTANGILYPVKMKLKDAKSQLKAQLRPLGEERKRRRSGNSSATTSVVSPRNVKGPRVPRGLRAANAKADLQERQAWIARLRPKRDSEAAQNSDHGEDLKAQDESTPNKPFPLINGKDRDAVMTDADSDIQKPMTAEERDFIAHTISKFRGKQLRTAIDILRRANNPSALTATSATRTLTLTTADLAPIPEKVLWQLYALCVNAISPTSPPLQRKPFPAHRERKRPSLVQALLHPHSPKLTSLKTFDLHDHMWHVLNPENFKTRNMGKAPVGADPEAVFDKEKMYDVDMAEGPKEKYWKEQVVTGLDSELESGGGAVKTRKVEKVPKIKNVVRKNPGKGPEKKKESSKSRKMDEKKDKDGKAKAPSGKNEKEKKDKTEKPKTSSDKPETKTNRNEKPAKAEKGKAMDDKKTKTNGQDEEMKDVKVEDRELRAAVDDLMSIDIDL
jgi:hypothetical protein